MLLVALALMGASPADAQPSPAACRQNIMRRVADGRWKYLVIAPGSDGAPTQSSGAFAMRIVGPETVEASYPGTSRPGFRLVQTATGYRSEGPDSAGKSVTAEIRVESCTAPDAAGVQTAMEVADDEPGPSGTRVQSRSILTAKEGMVMLTISERTVGSGEPYRWASNVVLYRIDGE